MLALLEMIPVVGDHLGLLEFAAWIYMLWYLFRGMRNVLRPGPRLTFREILAIGFSYISRGRDRAGARWRCTAR